MSHQLPSSSQPAQQDNALWRSTPRTHMLHAGVGLFLWGVACFVVEGLHEAVGRSVAALACVTLPVASVAPPVGAVASLLVTWVALALPQNTGIVSGMVVWGVVALLIARGLWLELNKTVLQDFPG